MKKILLALLLLGLGTLLTPALRERAQPQIDRFREGMGQRLEGPMSPVLNPYRRLGTEGEISRIMTEMVQQRNMGYDRPTPDDFQAYILGRVEDEDGIDRWGSPYILQPEQDSVTIVSPGPDLEYGTEDDVRVKFRYGAPDDHVRRRRR